MSRTHFRCDRVLTPLDASPAIGVRGLVEAWADLCATAGACQWRRAELATGFIVFKHFPGSFSQFFSRVRPPGKGKTAESDELCRKVMHCMALDCSLFETMSKSARPGPSSKACQSEITTRFWRSRANYAINCLFSVKESC